MFYSEYWAMLVAMSKKPIVTKKSKIVPSKSVKSFEFTNVKQGKAHKIPDRKYNPWTKLTALLGSIYSSFIAGMTPLRRKQTLAVVGILLVVCGYALSNSTNSSPTQKKYLNPTISSQLTIPVYMPLGLPFGYIVNDDIKTLKFNILYFTVTGPGNQRYSITEEAIPPNFDFSSFTKKFLNPEVFTTNIGTVTAGVVGANLIGSIQTNKNTWILINAISTNSLAQLETIARSFELY